MDSDRSEPEGIVHLDLLRDAVEMVKTSDDQTPPKNGPSILHEDHQWVIEFLE